MSADVDIDLPDRSELLKFIKHIPARLNVTDQKHNSGIYVTEIPRDVVNGCAAIDYHQADSRGYFKIDLLNVGVYKLIKDPAHYEEMLSVTPTWYKLWEDSDWAKQLIHIGHYTQLLKTMKPDSVQRMAAFISIIRPGKSHLQNKSWDKVFASVWDGDNSQGYTFKKSHSLGYAQLVALHMNLLNDSNI